MERRDGNGRGAAARITGEHGTRAAAGSSVPPAGRRHDPSKVADERRAGGSGGSGGGPRPDPPRRPVRTGKAGLFGIRPSPVNVKLVYAAYLASLAIPFAALIGALVAHQALRANPTAWLATHYVFQLRTFWIGLVANLVAYAASLAGIGLLLFPLIAVWVVARSVKGLIRVAHRAPVENPNTVFV